MTPVIRPVGDTALLVDFANAADAFARVVALDRSLAADAPAGMIEAVPATTTLLVVYDPFATRPTDLAPLLHDRLERASDAPVEGAEHIVRVSYDGPDLAAVAERTGLSSADVAAQHAAGTYHVANYGFAPGYAYLGGVPDALHLPRKTAAVRGHPVGSVMIAGAQCLITTLIMPTGWWVIGHTDFRVLDANAEKPFRFDPGDRVRFAAA
ncbi:allophanate hydrolase subunit 1 [Sphingomonas sp. SUN019]|uniref:5-oxoprolinase subunit B family protein n=1 Tax=Sphingomonas sp. SUN019 TaxID=2937788 RepID=UPI0021648D35|nr:allophanate hydrolase subunit 1 [Sphingomonas sp. SUN019]UVO50859.1 allophanate hydrolase subunit 1 [Sphingomonas sp. SUN019]